MRNSVARALTEITTPLPKMAVFVLEDDVIRDIPRMDRVKVIYKRGLSWLFNEVRKMFDGHNDSLPSKAKRKVNIIWVVPSDHINYENRNNRKIFGEMIKQVAKTFDCNHALELKQVWDPEDYNLYLRNEHRFSQQGTALLWKAVDRTIWFADTIIYKANEKETKTFQIYEVPGVLKQASFRLGPPVQGNSNNNNANSYLYRSSYRGRRGRGFRRFGGRRPFHYTNRRQPQTFNEYTNPPDNSDSDTEPKNQRRKLPTPPRDIPDFTTDSESD